MRASDRICHGTPLGGSARHSRGCKRGPANWKANRAKAQVPDELIARDGLEYGNGGEEGSEFGEGRAIIGEDLETKNLTGRQIAYP